MSSRTLTARAVYYHKWRAVQNMELMRALYPALEFAVERRVDLLFRTRYAVVMRRDGNVYPCIKLDAKTIVRARALAHGVHTPD